MAFALYDLVRTYPQSSITPYAMQVLQNINKEYNVGLVLTDINNREGDEPVVQHAAPYTYEPNTEHFVMIVCDSRAVRVDPLLVRISDFNKREYRMRTFNVKNVVLDELRTLITIGSFDNESKADDYITSMFLGDYVFGGIDKSKFTVTSISIKNYPVFYQAKNLEEYIQFINESKQ